MDWNSIFGNWRTTLTSLAIAFMYFLQQEGVTFPSDWKSFKTFAVSAAIAIFGAVAKDSNTGSKT